MIPLTSNLSTSPSLLTLQFTFSSISSATFSKRGLKATGSFYKTSSLDSSPIPEAFYKFVSFCKVFINSFCFFGFPNCIAFLGACLVCDGTFDSSCIQEGFVVDDIEDICLLSPVSPNADEPWYASLDILFELSLNEGSNLFLAISLYFFLAYSLASASLISYIFLCIFSSVESISR